MTFLHSQALWAIFLFNLENSFLASAISCNPEISTQCNGRAEIWCHSTSEIEAVRIYTNVSDVTVVNKKTQQNYTYDPRIWVEIPATPPHKKFKAVVYINNISLSDRLRYQLFVKVQSGFWGPNYITATVKGFCAPQIFLSEQEQKIVCKANGNGNGGILEWYDSNQTTWAKSEVEHVAVDGIVTLTSKMKFDPNSITDYCCRVTNENQEETTGPVCLSLSTVKPSLSFSSAQETRFERRRLFLLLPFLVTFIFFSLCLMVVWCRRGNLPVIRRRERTISDTPLCE
ncbi:uncharacterized protein LOC144767395 isoform X2 [Lissotriton helveticus]